MIGCMLENDVTENLAKTVVKVLRKCKAVQCVSLRKAFIGEDGVKLICNTMTSLNKGCGSNSSDSGSGKQRCFLTTLRLTCDPLDGPCCVPLAALLSLPPPRCSLVSLDLSENLLGDEGCRLLARALKDNPRSCLRVLDLSSNLLADEGMEALSDLLREGDGEGEGLCSLQSLAVSRNMFGDSPMMFLADALKSNQTLENLE